MSTRFGAFALMVTPSSRRTSHRLKFVMLRPRMIPSLPLRCAAPQSPNCIRPRSGAKVRALLCEHTHVILFRAKRRVAVHLSQPLAEWVQCVPVPVAARRHLDAYAAPINVVLGVSRVNQGADVAVLPPKSPTVWFRCADPVLRETVPQNRAGSS